MNETSGAFHNAQAYEQVLKNPNLAIKTLRLYYEKGQKIALLHAFNIIVDIWGKIENTSSGDAKFVELKLPVWISRGIKSEIEASILKGYKRSNGPKAGSAPATIKDQEHLERYLAFEEELRIANEQGKQISDIDAARLANQKLKKMNLLTSSRTIINSHKKVENDLNDPEHFWRYYPIPNSLISLKPFKK